MTFISLILAAQLLSVAEGPDRIAVLVGSNQPALGRNGLRYAHKDAESMADVLVQAGRFARQDTHVLADPDAKQVLEELDEALGVLKTRPGETMLLFYYSGHADDHALYVRGQPLDLGELRKRLDRADSTVRIGVVDACRGGGWTRTKGLTASAPFEVEVPLKLANEGSVLISSSSGLENAHESDSLGGSFFTHHFVGGLRGAADTTGDGVVTLNEAYAYAKERTIRDSALWLDSPQHPSFSMNLRGRSDLPLTTVSTSQTVLAVDEHRGPLQLIHVGSGVKVLDLAGGERRVLLAVAPGHYVLRRKEGEHMFAREIVVPANQSLEVDETSLVLDGSERLAAKGPMELHRSAQTTLPAHVVQLTAGVAVAHGIANALSPVDSLVTPVVGGAWGITDRVQLSFFLLLGGGLGGTYRFGERGRQEVLFSGSLGFGYSSVEGFLFQPNGVAEFRQWIGHQQALNARVAVAGGTFSELRSAQNWNVTYGVAYSVYLNEAVTLNVGASLDDELFLNGHYVQFHPSAETEPFSVSLGGSSLGLRPLPLVQVHLGPAFTVFGNENVRIRSNAAPSDSYQVGANWVF